MTRLLEAWKHVRDHAWYAATFWRAYETNAGIRLSVRGASPRVRFVMMKGYELEDARLCDAVLTRDDRVLELGASVGFVALYCLKTVGVSRLAMVEANPELPPRIAENFALNGVAMPALLNVAVGAEAGEAVLHLGTRHWDSSTQAGAAGMRQVRVPQRTLGAILRELDFAPNALVMDIEGGEVALADADLARFEKIVTELHPGIVGAQAAEGFVARLAALGFREAARAGQSRAYVRPTTH